MPAPFQVILERTGCCYAATGVARYINALQRALLAAGRPVLPAQPWPDGALAGRGLRRRARTLYYDWIGAPALPRGQSPERTLVHYTLAPARYPARHLCVVTVYDLNVFHTRADFGAYTRRVAARRFEQLDRAAAILTISDFVRGELLAARPHLEARTRTVYLGGSFPPPATATVPREEDLFLYVGGIGPNKNLRRALEAFARCRAECGRPCRFWLVGPVINEAYDTELKAFVHASGLADAVTFHGPQPDAFVADAFQRAACFVFPSLREGFGLPFIEAQANGCACIASRTTCLPEIGGDGARYVDPGRTDPLADAMIELRTHPDRAADLAARGRKNAERFTWARCADATWQAYEAAWAGRRP